MEPDTRTSPEKVRALLASVPDMINATGHDGLIAMFALARSMKIDIAAMIAEMLPSEPAELDKVLAALAVHALQARSDNGTELELTCKGGTITELLERHPDTDLVVVHVRADEPVAEPEAS